MHQRRYALEILKMYDIEHCNSTITPYEGRLQLSKSEDEQNVDHTQYKILIGSLHYLCNIRPNLAFSFSIASRFMERPKVSHLEAVKRILRYIKGTLGCGIIFPAVDTGKNVSYSVTQILIGAEIRMIESLRLVMSLCSAELQSIGALKRN